MSVPAEERDPELTCNTDGCHAWATKMSDRTRCRNCGGETPTKAENPAQGAPKNNGNAEKHALKADPKKYHERQPDEEKEWIRDLSATIQDRIRQTRGNVDPLDRVLARRIAIKLHIAAKASEYVDETGIVQEVFVEEGGYTKEIPNGIVQELRQYDREIVNELQKLGLIDDPQSQQADATQGLISILSEERHGDG